MTTSHAASSAAIASDAAPEPTTGPSGAVDPDSVSQDVSDWSKAVWLAGRIADRQDDHAALTAALEAERHLLATRLAQIDEALDVADKRLDADTAGARRWLEDWHASIRTEHDHKTVDLGPVELTSREATDWQWPSDDELLIRELVDVMEYYGDVVEERYVRRVDKRAFKKLLTVASNGQVVTPEGVPLEHVSAPRVVSFGLRRKATT